MSSLTSVTFAAGSTLSSIGEQAFAYVAGLSSITIPASVKSIGKAAFGSDGTSLLASVIFEAGSQLKSIEDQVFYGVVILTSIIIPAGVKSIGENAFANATSLDNVYIPRTNKLLLKTGTQSFYGRNVNVIYTE